MDYFPFRERFSDVNTHMEYNLWEDSQDNEVNLIPRFAKIELKVEWSNSTQQTWTNTSWHYPIFPIALPFGTNRFLPTISPPLVAKRIFPLPRDKQILRNGLAWLLACTVSSGNSQAFVDPRAQLQAEGKVCRAITPIPQRWGLADVVKEFPVETQPGVAFRAVLVAK